MPTSQLDRLYYAEENIRHSDSLNIHWTFEQCKAATDACCDHFGLARIEVKLKKVSKLSQAETDALAEIARLRVESGNLTGIITVDARLHKLSMSARRKTVKKSFYSAKTKSITYHEEMLNPLIVAHEFAHYADHRDRVQNLVSFRVPWHGDRHLIRTNQAIDFIKTLPGYTPAKSNRMANLVGWKAGNKSPGSLIIDTAYALLPEYCHCPKCAMNKPKKDFGMRVMTRGEGGIPTSVRRQSYCQSCRTHHKE